MKTIEIDAVEHMQARANLVLTDAAADALSRAFEVPPATGEVFALLYIAERKRRDGTREPGFRPGYMPANWHADEITQSWVVGRLRDGTEIRFLPQTDWGIGGNFAVDVLDAGQGIYSVQRL